MNSLLKKAIAECFGTFVLVFVACGVALATGNLVATALAFGLVIVAMAFSIGRISGCHINPAVSLGCLITKRMTLKEFGVYVCAQFVGAFIGALAVFGLYIWGTDASAMILRTAGSNLAFKEKLTAGGIFSAIIVEVVLTLIFVLVILVVTDKKAEKNGVAKYAGIIIGLTLTLVHLIGISLTGTSVNPARSFGTALADFVYSGEAVALKHVWIFLIAPLLGGALAAVAYNVFFAEDAKDESSNL